MMQNIDFLGNELKINDEVLSFYQHKLCVGKIYRITVNRVIIAYPGGVRKVSCSGRIVKLSSVASLVPESKVVEDRVYLGFFKVEPNWFHTFVAHKDRWNDMYLREIHIHEYVDDEDDTDFPDEYNLIPLSQEYQTLYQLGKD